jgi:hypothetical protein
VIGKVENKHFNLKVIHTEEWGDLFGGVDFKAPSRLTPTTLR